MFERKPWSRLEVSDSSTTAGASVSAVTSFYSSFPVAASGNCCCCCCCYWFYSSCLAADCCCSCCSLDLEDFLVKREISRLCKPDDLFDCFMAASEPPVCDIFATTDLVSSLAGLLSFFLGRNNFDIKFGFFALFVCFSVDC